MNKEQIIKFAREAGISESHAFGMFDFLERFAELVAAAERERCAEFCENQYEYYGHDHVFAAGIRARGEK